MIKNFTLHFSDLAKAMQFKRVLMFLTDKARDFDDPDITIIRTNRYDYKIQHFKHCL